MRRLVLLGLIAVLASAQTPPRFQTPDEGAKALVEAAKKGRAELSRLFGPGTADLLPTDKADTLIQQFVDASERKMQVDIDPTTGGFAIISVGPNDWPFPVPMIRIGDTWMFDVELGREEITARRLGANELAAIEVCLAYVDTQEQYAGADRDGNGVLEYARRIISTPGKKDGLYWDGPDSPVQDAVVKEFAAGVQGKEGGKPFRGYYFRILTAQGPAAAGGSANYVVNGKMMGGFALLAWPAEYGVTGVRSFLVNYDGVVYQKDLGMKTATVAAGLMEFHPDATWIPVEEEEPI